MEIVQRDAIRECRGVIYRITNTVDEKVYIGKTNNTFISRYGTKWWERTANRSLLTDVARLGPQAFSVEIYADNLSPAELVEMEAFLIWSHNSLHPHGYNMIRRGASHMAISAETRARLSAAQLGRRHSDETRRKIGLASKGRKSRCAGVPKSAEHRAKIAAGRVGKKWTMEQRLAVTGSNSQFRKGVEQFDLASGQIIGRFACIADASRALGLDESSIIRVCKQRKRSCGGFGWRYSL